MRCKQAASNVSVVKSIGCGDAWGLVYPRGFSPAVNGTPVEGVIAGVFAETQKVLNMKARQVGWIVTALLAVAPAGATGAPAVDGCDGPAAGQVQRDEERRQGQRRIPKWWMDEQPRAELGITEQQSAKIEQIFQSTLQAQRERWREHEKLEPLVEQLIKDGTADAAHVARQVERLHTLKSELNATRIITLYRMQQELTSPQREKLRRLEERREAERRKTTESQHRR
jgi:Spy/CpxP family protein refolding chaperone